MQDNKKAGQLALERLAHDPETTDVVEMQREMTKEYCENVMKAATAGAQVYKKPFYVVVLTKKEPLMPNVLRSYYFHRSTCPTPTYDQAVFRFDPDAETVEEVWVVPDEETCHQLYNYPLDIEPEDRELLLYVCDLFAGELLKKAKLLNGETEHDLPIVLSIRDDKEA